MSLKKVVDALICSVGGAPSVDRTQQTLVGGDPVTPDHTELKPNGQQKAYVVLSGEERSRGFVRPVRRSYIHVGPPGPKFPLRDLTPEESKRFNTGGEDDYVKFESYPQGYKGSSTGRFWTQAQINKIDKGCGTETRMNQEIAETYARDIHFYGGTFCVGCGVHLPVGERGEFVWSDNPDQRVGT